MPVKVLLTRGLPSKGQALLQQAVQSQKIELVEWKEDRSVSKQWLLENVKGAAGLLVMLTDKVDKDIIEAAGKDLKVISTMSAGFDHIELPALRTRGIRLAPDALTDATADIGVLLALMASRFGGEAIRAVLEGKWPQMPWSPLLMCGQTFTNKTYGFLGFGRIAQATLARMMPYGPAKVLFMTSKPGKPASADYYSLLKNAKIPIEPASSVDQLAEESDVLFICCALTESTKDLVNADFLAKMKETAVVVNTARGPVVNNDALAKALKERKILAAGLDVMTGEPNITPDHPLVQEKKCVVLPHIGSATVSARELMSEHAVMNLMAGLDGSKMVSEQTL